jgi:hypothetical protein
MSDGFIMAGAQISTFGAILIVASIYLLATVSMVIWLAARVLKGIFEYAKMAYHSFQFSYASRAQHN